MSEPTTTVHQVPLRTVVMTLGLVALAAGYGQFGATSALGDVAHAFGTVTNQTTFAARAGLSGLTLGVGTGIVRAASLAALPIASFADRIGRRRVLYVGGVVGLCITASTSLSPGYWWFVALFALARPALTAASALATVVTAELTSTRTRVTALTVVAAFAGAGAGLSAIVHGLVRGPDGFRVLFATALIPLVLVVVLVPKLHETVGATHTVHPPRLGTIPAEIRGRLGIVMGVTAVVSLISGPANTYAFIYAESFLKLSPSFVSAVVASSAITGVAGLLVGRRLANQLGRRPTYAIGAVASALAALLAYAGGRPEFVAGYMIGVFTGGLFAPAAAALVTESFPAAVRASASGWVVVAGVLGAVAGLAVWAIVADASGSTAWASVAAFLPGLPVLWLLRRLPETKGVALT
jgi:AAHS family benzoate transporter-like MFS transporter